MLAKWNLFTCIFTLVLSGCANLTEPYFHTQEPVELKFSFKDCMPYVHSTRVNGDVPPSLVFIQQVSQAIFSCEYFRGKPLRRYGNFGPQLKINGHKLFAGWGYAITDGSNSFTELINAQNFATFYKDFGKVKLNVNEGPLTVGDYDKKLRAFFVEVRSRYIIGTKTIAALGMFSFYKSRTKYRLFLWVQDYDLTRSEIAQRFGGMMELIVVPKTSIAEVKE